MGVPCHLFGYGIRVERLSDVILFMNRQGWSHHTQYGSHITKWTSIITFNNQIHLLWLIVADVLSSKCWRSCKIFSKNPNELSSSLEDLFGTSMIKPRHTQESICMPISDSQASVWTNFKDSLSHRNQYNGMTQRISCHRQTNPVEDILSSLIFVFASFHLTDERIPLAFT